MKAPVSSRPLITDGAKVRLRDGRTGAIRRDDRHWQFDWQLPGETLAGRCYFGLEQFRSLIYAGVVTATEGDAQAETQR